MHTHSALQTPAFFFESHRPSDESPRLFLWHVLSGKHRKLPSHFFGYDFFWRFLSVLPLLSRARARALRVLLAKQSISAAIAMGTSG
jgi:hypothetical protein